MGRAVRYGYVAALLLTAWTMGLELTHVLRWPATAGFTAELYAWLQQSLYLWFGFVSALFYLITVLVTGYLALLTRNHEVLRWFTTATFLIQVLVTLIFGAVLYPLSLRFPLGADGQPTTGWETLRLAWELGHVAGFLLFTASFLLLVIGLMRVATAARSER